MNEDQTKGQLEQLKGETKKHVGQWTDNESLEAEGRIEKGTGKLQEKYGDVKEDIAEAFNQHSRD